MNTGIYKNLRSDELIKRAIAQNEAIVTNSGVIVSNTHPHTGRSPKAKQIVLDDITRNTVDWSNNEITLPQIFDERLKYFLCYKNNADKVFIQDVKAVRDERYSINVRIYTATAKHSLFCRNMFIPCHVSDESGFAPDWEVLHFPSIAAEPSVLISLTKKLILISGTSYAGEIKKSIFTVLNYALPEAGILPMHCAVNVDRNRANPTIFFGLSGTGKTTLSADPKRILIGDDEHAWTDEGLTNFEGGCYAKTINLTKESEPEIWEACFKKGTMLENVVIKNGEPDFFDSTITENGRSSYKTSVIENADTAGFVDKHPKNIIMLTCDSFGVLPPIMKLSDDEAVKQFLIGYTSKVAGTEQGIKKPKCAFSACFGLPFMPRKPIEYAEILRKKIKKHNVNCWFVNTGWTGGPYGIGRRIPLKITRAIIEHINNGKLAKVRYFKHKYTGFSVPIVPDVIIPSEILEPEKGWESLHAYEKSVKHLMGLMEKQYMIYQ